MKELFIEVYLGLKEKKKDDDEIQKKKLTVQESCYHHCDWYNKGDK